MSNHLTELQIQKLVDGELSESARARVLELLESDPVESAWRTVALGFLEHQQLSRAIPNADRMIEKNAVGKQRHWSVRMAQQATMLAASALVGVSAVLMGHAWLRGPAGNSMVENLVDSPVERQMVAGDAVRGAEANRERRMETRIARPVPVMNVNLGNGGGGEGPSMSVPVYSPQDWPSAPASHPHAGFTPELQRHLESQGYRVVREPEWFSAPLEDGGQVLIPTERLLLQPEVN